MPNQATINGNIEVGEDFSSYSELELLDSALKLNNWVIDSHNKLSDGYNTFTISNGNIFINLHIYLKKVMWRHRSNDEKGIQFSANRVTQGYEVFQDANNITLMLGIYKRDIYDDYLIVAWDPFEWGNLGKACNCFVDVHALSKAFQIGFSTDSSKLSRKVFSFKPEFIHYYVTNKNKLHKSDLNVINEDDDQFIHLFEGFNKVYFGPPGTGKSHAIKEELKKLGAKADNYSRVTFHPDYDYHSFVGGYKPFTDKDDEDKIKYKFVPQVFTDLYVKAWSNANEHYYLVIEEINRGNCAEIFGDIFQLLDRNSEYNIEPSSELKAYLKELENKINEGVTEESNKIKLLFEGKLQMPNNLSILASMNTSDQSLYPMDSAFKRRWNWEYVPINTDCTVSNFFIEINKENNFYWLEFLKSVNQKIYSVTKSEDKQIGNWFINASKSNNIISKELFINKVLFYLWNDVFKDEAFHSDNIFVEKNVDGSKKRDISFNNFYNKDEQDRLLIHLLSDILEVPLLDSEDKENINYSQDNQLVNEAAEPKETYNESKPESEV